MSWNGQDSIHETVENPDPEEDLDLPRRQHEEVERPEDDIALTNIELIANTTEIIAENLSLLSEFEESMSESISSDFNKDEPKELVHIGFECNDNNFRNSQDQERLALNLAEYKDNTKINIASESNIHNSPNQNSVQDSVVDGCMDRNAVRDCSNSENDLKQTASITCENIQLSFCNYPSFSGDIKVSNTVEDATEDEIAGIQKTNDIDRLHDDNLDLHPQQQNINNCPSFEETVVSCTINCTETMRNISNDDSCEQLNNEQSNLLAPECDRKDSSPLIVSARNKNNADIHSLDLNPQLQGKQKFCDKDLENSHDSISPVVGKVSDYTPSLLQESDHSAIPSVEVSLTTNFISSAASPFELDTDMHNLDVASSPDVIDQSSNVSNGSYSDSHALNVTTNNFYDDLGKTMNSSSVIDKNCRHGETCLNNKDCVSHLKELSTNSTLSTSQQSSPSSSLVTSSVDYDSNNLQRNLVLALQSDDEDELLHELDAELLARPKSRSPLSSLVHRLQPSEQDESGKLLNGLQAFDVRQLQIHNRQLLEQLKIRDQEISRLTQEISIQKEELAHLSSNVNQCSCKDGGSSTTSADFLYLPQIKELEKTIAQQESELKGLKEKLANHDNSAKKTIISLQNEMKSRVDQITKMYEECQKEKDTVVVRFAESEAKFMEAKRMIEKYEAKAKEAIKEKDSMSNAVKTAKADKQRLVVSFETKCAEVSNLTKELEKLKEAVNSGEFRIKWLQNKIKDEQDQHKETKVALEKTNVKLKESREETEIIRKECQAIVKRYQESEEIKSNSLDKELKIKESELRTQMQEKNDTEEIHLMTKKELDSLKIQHKDVLEEIKTLKDKVHLLEVERQQNHLMIENYQEIMQKQKAENAALKSQISGLSTLEDDFKRAQNLIHTLDKDITELKLANRDLQKDMEACSERESKMLALQSELSRSNALIRSENTNLCNKSSLLANEVERLKKEVQELDDTVKNLKEEYNDEIVQKNNEIEKMKVQLSEKTKDCNDFKQKWEDELDNLKTLKRRHASNIKDLTRQLQQVKKKLESLEGKGDAGSMGSRTNSNGSLNSIDTAQHPQVQHQQQLQQETVITEQVEVDKQVLIERIVRLQKAHARKNEKLEFLGEHIQQLLEEIKKKNKIIQTYILREEAGTLSSEEMDSNKMEIQKEIQSLLARKGGIMASVYSVHQQDGTMTLDLSLQINRKLQAVLEDTLLKNITLKENLDTLGEEIARLSQENRKLQLSLQDLQHHTQQVQA